jgi:hypothetical protein
MKFQRTFDIWSVPAPLYKHIQPGQWVYAGDRSNKGIYLGLTQRGTVVCAWYQNAKAQGRGKFKWYIRTLRNYALAH